MAKRKEYREPCKKCPRCGGTGLIIDIAEDTAWQWRASRRARNISLKEMAQRLRVSANFVSMLENGKKKWPHGMEFKYLAVLKDIKYVDALS